MIQLTEDFRIYITKSNHILEQRVSVFKEKSQEKVMEWKEVGFFSSITSAIKAALKEDTRNAQSLNEVIERIDTFENKIESELKGV